MPRVALIGENSIEYVSILLDIWNNGDCAVLLDWRIPFETAYRMMLEAGVVECRIEVQLLKNMSLPKDSIITFSTFDISERSPVLLPDNIRNKYQENTDNNEAIILYSSGTTGKSKGIILSHYAITYNADAILDYMSLSKYDCLYIAKSLSHSSTLIGELLVSLRCGCSIVLAPTVVPPRYVLNCIAKFSVTTICLNPTLLQIFANECRKKVYDLHTLKTIYCSGAILNDKVYQNAHNIFYGINIFNAYGLSEAGPRVAAQTKNCCKNNSVGTAIRGVEIIIVDEKGNPVTNNTRGIIHVNTPSLYSGYVSGTKKHSSLYNGWLNTGDYGYFDEYNELHVVDRVDDVIIINAHKLYPGDIERLILDELQVSDCAVCKFTYNGIESIGCLYVSDKECFGDITRKLTKFLMQYEIPKKFIKVDKIPHNLHGKPDKAEISRILSDFDREDINYGR